MQTSMDQTFIVIEGSIGQQLSRFIGQTRSAGLDPEIERMSLACTRSRLRTGRAHVPC